MSEPMIIDEKKLLGALGLCARAGKLTAGVPMICEALRERGAKKPLAVFMAADVSDNTRKKLSDKCGYYGVRLVSLGCDSGTLSRAVGKMSAVAAVAVADKQLYSLAEKYFRSVDSV